MFIVERQLFLQCVVCDVQGSKLDKDRHINNSNFGINFIFNIISKLATKVIYELNHLYCIC